MVFQPRLNAFRGICISMVFLTHTGFLDCGWMGVQAFFVLSGYLITGILLESQRAGVDAGTHFKNFYARRALRIFPVYFAFLGLPVLVAAMAGDQWLSAFKASFFDNAPYLFTYTLNFSLLNNDTFSVPYAHLWSLSVEEQFYLVWPLLLYFTPSRRHVDVCIGIVLAGPLIRFAELLWRWHADPLGVHSLAGFIYFFTASHIDAFALGALLNFRNESARVGDIIRKCTKWIPALFVVTSLFMLAMARLAHYNISLNSLGWPSFLVYFYAYIWGYSLLNGLFFVGLANIDAMKWVMDSRLLQRLGKISYGFYIFHFPLLWLVMMNTGAQRGEFDLRTVGIVLAAFAMTWAVAEISFRYLETPMLNLKGRFRSKEASGIVKPLPEAS